VNKPEPIKQAHELGGWGSKRGVFPLKGGGAITALDWDGPVLRVAQSVRQGSKAEIIHFAAERVDHALEVAKAEPEASGARLAEALQRLRIKPGTVVMGIPRGLVFLRTITLPQPETHDELVSMVLFQVNKDLPFRPEEAVIDFQVKALPPPAAPSQNGEPVGKETPESAAPASGKLEVLVAVVKNEVVDYYQRLAKAGGFKLAALSLDSYANTRGIEACGAANGRQAVAVVSVRQAEVIIDVIVGGALAFSRKAAFPQAGAEEVEVEEKAGGANGEAKVAAGAAGYLESMTIEVVRSLHNYEGLEGHPPVEEILVTGASGPQAALVEALAERCKLPCRRLDPVSALGVTSGDGEFGAGALTAFGLALSALDQVQWPFDFLHPKRLPVARNVRRLQAMAAAAALLLLVGGGWGTFAWMKHGRQKEIQQLQTEYESAVKNRAVYRDMRSKAKTVHDWALEKREWLDHYAYLSTLLPDCSEVYVTSISSGQGGVLHLSVQARSGDVLARLDKRLRDAGYRLKPLAVTPSSDKYGYGFQSSLELTLPAKMKLDLAAAKAPERPGDDVSMNPPRAGASSSAPRASAPASATKSPGGRKQP
jgi:Tfp pilus assembly PilM family ATPase